MTEKHDSAESQTAPQAPKERTRIEVDPSALVARTIAGTAPDAIPTDDGPEVEVDVPKAFILTDDRHAQHHYKPGRQKMLKAHAEHPYTAANGVTLAKND